MVGSFTADLGVVSGAGAKFLLYELLLERHVFAGPPMLPSLIAFGNPAIEEAILQVHQRLLRYLLLRYQLGVLPPYVGDGTLGHWTTDQLVEKPLDLPVDAWLSSTGNMRLLEVASPPLEDYGAYLRAVPTPAIPLESDLRVFDGSSVLTGHVLTTPVGG